MAINTVADAAVNQEIVALRMGVALSSRQEMTLALTRLRSMVGSWKARRIAGDLGVPAYLCDEVCR